MTLAQLRSWYKDAKRYKDSHRYATMIMELCTEVIRLRAIADERHGEYSEFTLMPFGAHKGKKLADVPEDYLRWWYGQFKDRQEISIDADFGKYPERGAAIMKLKLYDYLTRRFDGDEIQNSPDDT